MINQINTLKPWLSLDEQVAKLRSKNLRITDEQKAKDYLSRIGYYRLVVIGIHLENSSLSMEVT